MRIVVGLLTGLAMLAPLCVASGGAHAVDASMYYEPGRPMPAPGGPMMQPPFRPGFAGPMRPGFGGLMRPGFAGTMRPGFAGPLRQGFGGPMRPGFAGPMRPGFAAPFRPGLAGPLGPGFAGALRPAYAGALPPRLGARRFDAPGGRVCFNPAETREKIAAHRLTEPFRALRTGRLQGQALRARLCRWNPDEFVYEIAVLQSDGRIVHVYMNAQNGQNVAPFGDFDRQSRSDRQ